MLSRCFFISFLIITQFSSLAYAKNLINEINYINPDTTYNAVIEIPAGTSLKNEFNKKTGIIEPDIKNGKPRVIDYLPYVGNYGFIPQTLSGDEDAIDIIVLDDNVKIGTIQKVKVIGAIKILDKGKVDTKLLALPLEGNFKEINDISELFIRYPGVVEIVKIWFQNYKGSSKINFTGYANSKEAKEIIEKAYLKWSKNKAKD